MTAPLQMKDRQMATLKPKRQKLRDKIAIVKYLRMKEYVFEAEIIKHPDLNAAYIEFPYDVEKEFGTKGQVKVKAWYDGAEYRGSLIRMNSPCHIIGLTQEMRQRIGKQAGDRVRVTLVRDLEPRTIELPNDLEMLLQENPEAREFFDRLSFTNRKEYVVWITSAKRAETRSNRLQETIGLLMRHIKWSDKGSSGKPSTVEEYLQGLDAERREAVQPLRELLLSWVPGATECISYQMPTVYYKGNLVSYLAAKAHIGFYPHSGSTLSQIKDIPKGYKTLAGTLQIPYGKPLPVDILKQAVLLRMKENETRERE